MAQLKNDLTAFGTIGSGILHPALNHRFIAHFEDENGTVFPLITNQVTEISEMFTDTEDGNGKSKNSVYLYVQADYRYLVLKNLLALQKQCENKVPPKTTNSVNLVVDYMDGGDGILRRQIFSNIEIKSIHQSSLRYDVRDHTFYEFRKTDSPKIPDKIETELEATLKNFQIVKTESYQSGTVTFNVEINYRGLTNLFDDGKGTLE